MIEKVCIDGSFRHHYPPGSIPSISPAQVSSETLEMGEYAPLGAAHVHEFKMPTNTIPTSPFVAGARFKVEVVYTCDALAGEVLRREWDIEFRIV